MHQKTIQEARIETTLDHYMEDSALVIALTLAATDCERARVMHLMGRRQNLLAHRAAYRGQMTEKRHARGEIYSDAKVRAINGFAPTKLELDRDVRALYQSQTDVGGVLKNHARIHFGQGLASQRNMLSYETGDTIEESRKMLALEEKFAADWVDAIDDAVFRAELREIRREAATLYRTANTSMFFVSTPEYPGSDMIDSVQLGRAWKKLDALAMLLKLRPLSSFIGFADQAADDSAPAAEILATVEALKMALEKGTQSISSKKAVLAVLKQLREALLWLLAQNGRAHFDVDL